jgi:hypothetical protein
MTILRKLPLALLLGTFLPIAISITNRVFPPASSPAEIEKYVTMVDILSIAFVLTIWSAAMTVAIGCFLVVVMKGPAYVADAYELVDSSHPKPRRRDLQTDMPRGEQEYIPCDQGLRPIRSAGDPE